MLERLNPHDPAQVEWVAKRCTLSRLTGRITEESIAAFRITGTDIALLASVGTTKDTHKRACWIEGLGGHVERKNRRAILRAVLMECEHMAWLDGCTELRIEAETRTALKTRLFARFGFEAVTLPTGLIMRKALGNG